MNWIYLRESTYRIRISMMNLETPTSSRPASVSRIYQNVMEPLVEREIERQFKRLPRHLARYIDPIDVATHALNRLPPLYASTEKGKNCQELAGTTKLKGNIETAVRQAIAAVQRDPIRKEIPLTGRPGTDTAKKALLELQEWLIARNLADLDPVGWDNLVPTFRSALRKVLLPHIGAMKRLQSLLVDKYRMSLDEEITYENVVKVVEEAIALAGERQSLD
ncbi:late competence development ComFB family protein [Pannus brasiliensis CCIBt3594]|uniref:Late competence development ComFB family protein n=1 Tax=Pannus brasiliensis CCIBt3594 TaxID=1427578 RepID=A0AAW9QWE2_9CHRO